MSKLIVAFRNFTNASKTEEGRPSRERACSFLYPGVLHVAAVDIRSFQIKDQAAESCALLNVT